LPVGIQVASIFADVISYAATEKTVGDHGLSILTEQDCAVWRGFEGKDICQDEAVNGDTLVAEDAPEDNDQLANLAETETETEEVVAAVEEPAYEQPQTVVISSAGVENMPPPAAVEPVPMAEVETVEVETLTPPAIEPEKAVTVTVIEPEQAPAVIPEENRGGMFYVIASYHRSADAKRFADNQRDLSTTVLSGTANGKSVYRVAVGPVGKPDRKGTMRKLRTDGYKDVWALKLRNPKIIVEVAELN